MTDLVKWNVIVSAVDKHDNPWLQIEQLQMEVERLQAALTPNADTQAAYMGEFQFGLPVIDKDGDEFMRSVNVPWTTIKKIMERIGKYAAIRNQDTDK